MSQTDFYSFPNRGTAGNSKVLSGKLPAASVDTGENNKESMFVWLGLLLNKLRRDSGFSLESKILLFYSFLMKPFLPEREENCLFPKWTFS